jgi:P4 family phage/plasmid primase-like protien
MTPKPPSVRVYESSPAGRTINEILGNTNRFVLWKWKWKPPEGRKAGKWDKPPISPHTEQEIDATDPSNWLTFGDACRLCNARTDGIGFALGPKDNRLGIVAVDIDGCIDDDGAIDPEAMQIVEGLESYTERTPSGRGLRVLVWATKPGDKCKHTKRKVELYEHGRYLTLTGRRLEGTWPAIEKRQEELAALYHDLFDQADEPKHETNGALNGHQSTDQIWAGEDSPKAKKSASDSGLTDDDLLTRARLSKNGREFQSLFDRGDATAHNGDASSADLALLNMLAFWLAKDAGRMERAFSQSALGQRGKWKERADYRKSSIDKAIAGCTEVYDPGVVLKIGSKTSVASNGAPREIKVNEAPDDPNRLARLFLKQMRLDGVYTLRYYQGEWIWWERAYKPVKDSELCSKIARAIKEEFDRLNKLAIAFWEQSGGKDQAGKAIPKPVARKVGRALVSNVMLALQGMTLLKGRTEPPCWISGNSSFDASEMIPTKNALVHLPSVVIGENVDPATMSVKPTPRFFSTFSLDFAFNPGAEPPTEWLRFLWDVWEGDRQSVDTLQEWFGLCLTPETRHEKILALIGPKRAGKDTIGRVLTGIVGSDNTAGPTLAGLGTTFGLAPLIGKPLAIVSDARISGRTDSAIIVERLLAISGRGRLTVDRKFLDSWEGNLPTRFVLISNELPRLADSSGALASRLVILRLTKSFYGKEDMGLYDRLKPELPGILLWAVEGWQRLRARGHFLQPASGNELLESLEELSSPVLAFVRQCCDVGPVHESETSRLFDGWKQWCTENGRKEPGTQQSFARDLRAASPGVRTCKTTRAGKQFRVYQGIDMKVAI